MEDSDQDISDDSSVEENLNNFDTLPNYDIYEKEYDWSSFNREGSQKTYGNNQNQKSTKKCPTPVTVTTEAVSCFNTPIKNL